MFATTPGAPGLGRGPRGRPGEFSRGLRVWTGPAGRSTDGTPRRPPRRTRSTIDWWVFTGFGAQASGPFFWRSHECSQSLARRSAPDLLDRARQADARGDGRNGVAVPEVNERFWSKVDRSGGPDACWLWTAGCSSEGYGSFRVLGRVVGAHLFAYTLLCGPVADGLVVRHKCDNRRCCNPAHHVLGTQLQNVRDRVERGRCARGERNGRCKLSDADLDEMRAFYATGGWRQRDLASAFGISPDHCGELLRGLHRGTLSRRSGERGGDGVQTGEMISESVRDAA